MTAPTVTEPVGWTLIIGERCRQLEVEGYRSDRDDTYTAGQLAKAARCYLSMAADARNVGPPAGWPWPRDAWKPRDRPSNLIRAGALLLAEADRLARAGRRAQAEAVRRNAKAIAEGLTRLLTAPPARP